MPPITALLQTRNDALRLGRTLETLLPCSEILIVDHHSADATCRIAREYGARVIVPDRVPNSHAPANHYLDLARCDWILCLAPGESITENLQASLFEWGSLPRPTIVGGASGGPAFSVLVREQTGKNWQESPRWETRLIPRSWTRWQGRLPASEPAAVALEGELLRFDLP